MKRLSALFAAVVISLTVVAAQPSSLRERLQYHIGFLASDSLRGRAAGSAEGIKAGDYIVAQMQSMGLHVNTAALKADGKEFRNIVGRIDGHCDSMIVIGAHYDHLGVIDHRIYPGADDNASGTAALIELARNLVSNGSTPRYTILLVAFDAEEPGLYGSRHMASNTAVDKIKLMISLDMVGWYNSENSLTIMGTGTLNGADHLLKTAAAENGITLKRKPFETSLFTATDTQWFANEGVPTFAITTGTKSPYHKPEDTADKIDYQGLEKIVGFMTSLTEQITSADNMIAASGRRSFKHGGSKRFSGGITFGAGSNYHYYSEGALVGKSAFAFNSGLFVQYNLFDMLALRMAALYEERSADMPEKSDIFGSSRRLKERTITVPLDLMLTTSNRQPVYAAASFGGYCSRVVGATLDGTGLNLANEKINPVEYGIQWGLGVNIYNLYLSSQMRYALTDVFGDVKVSNRSTYFTVGFCF